MFYYPNLIIRIQSQVNARAVGVKRTEVEVKKKWKDLLSKAKKDASSQKNSPTGVGPRQHISPYSDIILDIYGKESPSVIGTVLKCFQFHPSHVAACFVGLFTGRSVGYNNVADRVVYNSLTEVNGYAENYVRSCVPQEAETVITVRRGLNVVFHMCRI